MMKIPHLDHVKKRVLSLASMHRSADYKITQAKVEDLLIEFEPLKIDLIPNEKDELFDVMGRNGENTGVKAPRWLCHLVGIRHASAHIALYFVAQEIRLLVLQVRSWTKNDSPGHLDISVGGHVKSGNSPSETAIMEMSEEVGIQVPDLVEEELKRITGYSAYNSMGDFFHNNEWCELFTATIKPEAFSRVRFADGEVSGMYLCPESELLALLQQSSYPIAAALNNFLLQIKKV